MNRIKEKTLEFFDPSRSVLLFIIGTATLTFVLTALYDFATSEVDGEVVTGWPLLGSWFILIIIISMTQSQPGRGSLSDDETATAQRAHRDG